jgi:hypothetical protein
MLDQMLDRECRDIDLLAHLHQVTAVDENRGAIGEHDGGTGGAGEAGKPGEALGAGRHIFVLVTVSARHDEAVEAAALELGTQRRKVLAAGAALGTVIEGLKSRFEHHRQFTFSLSEGGACLDA